MPEPAARDRRQVRQSRARVGPPVGPRVRGHACGTPARAPAAGGRRRGTRAPGLPRPAHCGPGGHRRRVPGQTLEQAQRFDVSSGFPCERGLRCTQGAPESRTEAPEGGEASGGKAPARRGRAGSCLDRAAAGAGFPVGRCAGAFSAERAKGVKSTLCWAPGLSGAPAPQPRAAILDRGLRHSRQECIVRSSAGPGALSPCLLDSTSPY